MGRSDQLVLLKPSKLKRVVSVKINLTPIPNTNINIKQYQYQPILIFKIKKSLGLNED